MAFRRIFLGPLYRLYENLLRKQVNGFEKPQHIGIILDGNRRAARSLNIPMTMGYEIGSNKLEDVLEWMWDLNVKVVSVWIFSTENFQRDIDQVGTIMKMAEEKTKKIRDDKKIHDRGVQVRYSGDLTKLPES
ncbi:MAG: undecaprenyl diphosphate synthase family protein, partial [Candidatus Heimdallarchaeota archaeon]